MLGCVAGADALDAYLRAAGREALREGVGYRRFPGERFRRENLQRWHVEPKYNSRHSYKHRLRRCVTGRFAMLRSIRGRIDLGLNQIRRRLLKAVERAVERACEVLASRPSALISDVDGTLSRIVPNPPDATVSETVRAMLRRLLPHLDLLGVVTGRESDVARRMVGVEGMSYVGSYALQPGALGPEADGQVSSVKQAVLPYLERMPCVKLEHKDVSFALHFRNCDDPPGVRSRLLAVVEPLVASSGAKLVEGKQVIEVVPRELPDKGTAFARLLSERSIDGAIFMGDDLGDTAAFREVRRRRNEDGHPGLAIAVVDAETPAAVREYADLTLDGVDEVEAFLDGLATQLEERL